MDTRLAFTAFNAEAEDLFYEEEENCQKEERAREKGPMRERGLWLGLSTVDSLA